MGARPDEARAGMKTIDIAVVGSGSLARAVVMALARERAAPMSVMVVARNADALGSLALLARAQAASLGSGVDVTAEVCDFSPAALDALFARYRPGIVLMLASLQSPWSMGEVWRQWVGRLGYGVTLPLQALLADRVFRAVLQRHPQTALINGCYPDLANRVLVERGIPVAAGIGNIAIVDAAIRSVLPGERPTLLAHHAHVAAMIRGDWAGLPMPRVWQGARCLSDAEVAAQTRAIRLPADDRLNALTGQIAVPMLLALAGRSDSWHGHAPGVHGHPGGYPVTADVDGIRLRLPAGVSLESAIATNAAFGRFDGIVVEDGRYRLAQGDALPASLRSWRAIDLELQAEALARFRRESDPPA
jgi:hypothetical protein